MSRLFDEFANERADREYWAMRQEAEYAEMQRDKARAEEQEYYNELAEQEHETEQKDYRFQNLTSYTEDGNHLQAPMSPMLAAQNVAKHLEIPIACLIRFQNPQTTSGMDHLIIRANEHRYFAFIDMGVSCLMVGTWHALEPGVVIGELYLSEITPERMQYHREDCEIRNKKDNPIIVLDEAGWIDLFERVHAADFKPKPYSK